jgi:hypothetical protein
LCGIEHGIAVCEQQARTGCRVLFAIVLCFGSTVGKLPEHDRGSLFPLANLCPAFLPLVVRGPFSAFVALCLRCSP